MSIKTGSLSINSENIFPIIKKWLYSDHDIFAREVISNACDAITKLHKLSMLSEYEYPDGHKDSIRIVVDPDAKTLQFTDTGLGMTAEEVEKISRTESGSGAILIGLEGDREKYYPAIVEYDGKAGRFVYDYDLLVEAFMGEFKENEDPYTDAVEWVDYNVVRSLPYYGDRAPVIRYDDGEDGEESDDRTEN